jgi:hypothetical protein
MSLGRALLYRVLCGLERVFPAPVDQPIPRQEEIVARLQSSFRRYCAEYRRGMADSIMKQQREHYYREKVTIDPRD